jgi:hypothetical protein
MVGAAAAVLRTELSGAEMRGVGYEILLRASKQEQKQKAEDSPATRCDRVRNVC